MNKLLFALSTLIIATSCADDMTRYDALEGEEIRATVHMQDFTYDDDTRTTLSLGEEGLSFAWNDDDLIGVFPIYPEPNSQARKAIKTIENCQDGHYAEFNGGGWLLNRSYTYSAYYPYNGKLPISTNYDEIPIKMGGQAQTGNGSTSHLGKYDFMCAPSTFVTTKRPDGSDCVVAFDFKHLVAIWQVTVLTNGIAAEWSHMTITNTDGEEVFTTEARMNTSTCEVTPTASASHMDLALNDIVTTTEDQYITLFISVLPAETGNISLSLFTADGEEYTAPLTSKSLTAGRATRSVAYELNRKAE
ncbi:MAG: fimbrillin family protein [Bacteroidaceae bacterium]|nr:fimbrillin family protein [Bacteroidaceae bacterium]